MATLKTLKHLELEASREAALVDKLRRKFAEKGLRDAAKNIVMFERSMQIGPKITHFHINNSDYDCQ